MSELKLGSTVRRLREATGLSLRAVAEKSGFSASFISQVENDQASPSIASMERIAGAFGLTLAEFFRELDGSGATAGHATEASEDTVRSEWSKARIAYLAPGNPNVRILPLLVTLDPGGSSGSRPFPAPSEEFALVLEGSVVLTTERSEQVLDAGHAATIRAGESRRWHNRSQATARFLIAAVR
jgi:transcriptional regulator with XRE-family HTH domain